MNDFCLTFKGNVSYVTLCIFLIKGSQIFACHCYIEPPKMLTLINVRAAQTQHTKDMYT